MRPTPVVLASATALLLSLTACGDTDGSTEYVEGGTFTVALYEDIGGQMNPYASWAAFNDLSPWAYDTLVNVTDDGTIVSGLAEEWAADVTSADFTLKDGITCSDGTELAASGVAAAIEYTNAPDNASIMYGLRNPAVPLTVTADDAARTIHVESAEPTSFLLHTVGLLPIICPAGLDDMTMLDDATIGTGPYELTDAVPGQSYTLTIRDDYAWGPDGATTTEPGLPDTVVLRFVDGEATAANLLLSGELNYARVTGQDRTRLEAQDLGHTESLEAGAWLVFNGADGRPTSDERVRRGIVQALDFDQLVTIATQGDDTAATGLTPNQRAACPGDTLTGNLPPFDLDAAKQVLDEAGWLVGADGVRERDGNRLELKLRFQSSNPGEKPTAEYIAEELGKIGIAVELSEDTYEALLQWWFETGDFDLALSSMGLFLPSDPVPYLTGEPAPEGSNIFGVQNPEYADLVGQASALAGDDACELYHQAELALWEQVNLAPISNIAIRGYFAGAEGDGPVYGTYAPAPTSIRIVG